LLVEIFERPPIEESFSKDKDR